MHTETYDAQFEGERVFLKSRAVPYIDGDREMRQRRAATQQRNRASGAGPSPYREGRADPVQIGFLEAAVYGNGPQSRLMRSRSTPRHSAREPSDSVAAPAAAATLPRPLPRSSSMRSDVVRESGSHQPTLAELVSQRKHVPLPDLSRQDGLPSVAEEENGDEDATTSFDSGASSRQRDRRRALARLTVPTALHLQRVSKNSERRRQRQREARARSAIQRSESPVSDGHGSPSPVRRLRRRPWGGSAPMLPALRKGADQGGASSPSVTHPSTGRATVPRDSSAERAGHKGMGRTRDTARASGRAQTRTNSRRSMEAGAAEEEGGTLPALLHEPVSAVEERQPMQGHTDVLVAKAVACLDRGEPASALEHCRVALSHDHRHFGARFQHGVAEFHLGHYEAAVRDLTAAMRAPTAARHRLEFAFYNRGLAHAQLGEYDAAVEDLGRALRKDPVNKLFWDARGLIHRRALQFREARDDYTTLRSLARRKPDDEVAKRILEAQQRFKQQEEGGDAEGACRTQPCSGAVSPPPAPFSQRTRRTRRPRSGAPCARRPSAAPTRSAACWRGSARCGARSSSASPTTCWRACGARWSWRPSTPGTGSLTPVRRRSSCPSLRRVPIPPAHSLVVRPQTRWETSSTLSSRAPSPCGCR